MGIFDKIKKSKKTEDSGAAEKKPKTTRKPKKGDETVSGHTNSSLLTVSVSGDVLSERIVLKRPHVSEKAHGLSLANKYVFIVSDNATKPQVREAVRKQFGVTPVRVTMTRKRTKGRRYYSSVSPVHVVKKATIMLKPGEKIDVFTA